MTALLCLALSLSGCGGGGGGGGGPTRAPVAAFETEEYFRSPGLQLVDAAPAYARGATGRGATVAVIDTGIDMDHPEFRGAISSSSIDIVSGSDAFIDDEDGHGTAVAGVIAARRNGELAHGLAFDGTLLAIRADALGSCAGGCAFAESDVASATDYAVTNGARVINYSLGGGSSIGSRLKSSLAAAADDDTVLVLAAGNGGSAAPTFPAAVAGDPAVRGRAIAVGSVGAAGEISAFSNRAGDLAEIFMVAPGEGIVTARAGGGGTVVSGTSFAAPHVSGAAALLLGAAPFLSADEVVDLLFATALDLGAPGIDPVYGNGLLDVSEALRPQGALSVPLGERVDGPQAPLAGTGLVLGRAMSMPSDLPPLIFLDDYDRPYQVELDAMVGRRSSSFDLGRRLGPPSPSKTVTLEGASGARTTFTLIGDADLEEPWRRTFRPVDRAHGYGWSFASERGFEITLAMGGTARGADEVPDAAGLITAPLFAPPHASMVGDVVGLRQALGGGWSLGLIAAQGNGAEAGDDTLAAADVALRTSSGGRLKLGIGWLEEPRGPLDSRGTGALAVGGGRTSLLSLAGSLPVAEDYALFGRFGWGRTKVEDRAGLLRDMSTLESVGVAAGVSRRGLLTGSDRLTIAVAQPLRVEAGDALLDRPVGRTIDGAIPRERTRIEVEPDGRELAFEAGYQTDLSARSELSLNWLSRLQPDHERDATPWHGLTVILRHRL
jgi:hypothetical protein